MFLKTKKREISLSGKALMELIHTVQNKKGDFRFKASGTSMTPSICNDDIITLTPINDSPPKPGEVVAFRHPESNCLIIHRVTAVSQNMYSIRGDNARNTDRDIPMKNIIGVVTRVERGGKPVFWPHRFNYPLWANFYFRINLVRLKIKHLMQKIVRVLIK
jgi:signal peptidase I